MKRILEEIINRNTEGNYLLSSSDKAQMISEILDLFGVMHRSFQGTNGYAIEHLINDTYQVVDRIDGTVHHQGTKRDCEVYLNGT